MRTFVVTNEPLRVAGALTAGGLGGAVVMAILVNIFANLDAGQHAFTDVTPLVIFWNSVAFCLFTLPAAWFLGLPLYFVLRQLNLVRVWVGTVAGVVVGLAIPHAFGLLAAAISFQRPAVMPWQAALWFGLSGAAPGALVGFLLRGREPKVKT
jgi:hypothetical protein